MNKIRKAFTCLVFMSVICSACSDDGLHKTNSLNNSTMDVKDKTQNLSFKPLSDKLTTRTLTINEAYKQKRSDVFVQDSATVIKLLKDDNHGARHQRFIIDIGAGKTVLVAHNIDLAPRINALKVGDRIEFRGEYIYKPKGGVLHWTHHDPKNKIIGGWITHEDEEYQ